MKIKLTVAERIVVQSLLPDKGSFINLKLITKVKEECSFSEEEHKLYKFQQIGEGRVKWATPSDISSDKEIDFGDVVFELVKDKLMELNKKEELEAQHLSLYEKFVTGNK